MGIFSNGVIWYEDKDGSIQQKPASPESCKAEAASQLRMVAAFLDENAEALVGDMDSTYILDTGLHFEFNVLERDSIATVKVTKEHFVMSKTAE